MGGGTDSRQKKKTSIEWGAAPIDARGPTPRTRLAWLRTHARTHARTGHWPRVVCVHVLDRAGGAAPSARVCIGGGCGKRERREEGERWWLGVRERERQSAQVSPLVPEQSMHFSEGVTAATPWRVGVGVERALRGRVSRAGGGTACVKASFRFLPSLSRLSNNKRCTCLSPYLLLPSQLAHAPPPPPPPCTAVHAPDPTTRSTGGGGTKRRSSRDEHTTETEEQAMAAPAAQGGTCTRKAGYSAPAAAGSMAAL